MQARDKCMERLRSLLPAGARVVEVAARMTRPSPEPVDAVVALEEPHLKRTAAWLAKGGLLAGRRRVALEGPIEQGWTGAPLNFTRVEASDLLEPVAEAGLEPVWAEVTSVEDVRGRPVSFLWFIARKP